MNHPYDNDCRDRLIDAVLYGCIVVLISLAAVLVMLIVGEWDALNEFIRRI